MSNVTEFVKAALELGHECNVISNNEGNAYIADVLAKFAPEKITGHLAIQRDSFSVPLEPHEFTFSESLGAEPVYIFFDQGGVDKGFVIMLPDGRTLGAVLGNAFGMEYFVSNAEKDYLIAVNWYVIEGAGTAAALLRDLV